MISKDIFLKRVVENYRNHAHADSFPVDAIASLHCGAFRSSLSGLW